MRIMREEVESMATLARLELSDKESDEYTLQINDFLEYAGILEKLPTEQVIPTIHAIPLANVLREDIVQPSMPQHQMLSSAPDAENGFFKVPKIV